MFASINFFNWSASASRLTLGALVVALSVTVADARPALRDNETVFGGLLALAVAHEIRTNCPSIKARMLRAYNYLVSLKKTARSQGYSNAEIDTFVKSEVEQERLRQHTYAYLDAQGVDRTDPQSFCTLGHAQISASTRIGSLLRRR